jgi:hypothetical protein
VQRPEAWPRHSSTTLDRTKAGMSEHPFFERDEYWDSDVLDAVARDDPSELCSVAVVVGMSHPDFEWALARCIEWSGHRDPYVRGNAILSFGHLARRFGHMDQCVGPIIQSAMVDDDEHVRGHAHSAADDISWYTDWGFDGCEMRECEGRRFPRKQKP